MRDFDRRKCLSYLKMGVTTTWLPLVLVVVIFATPALSAQPRVVCYYTNWSVYRPGTARFNPQNINPYLCTHLVYAFGGFTKDNTLKPFDKYQDIEKGGYAKFNGLKTYNKNLKTLLAIGGWNEGSSRFSPMVASRDSRKEFVRNTIKFLRQNHFDGLDLDWEYPAAREGGKPKDRENYAKLVKELREEFERESEKTGKPRLLLTMAVPAGIENIQKGYDIETLNKYLDWMNLLSYDYHSAFEPAVNHHAPLYPLEEPNEYSVDNELNIDYTIKFYLENGVDRNKLVLGIPTYGRSYTLFNPDAVEIGSPADGPGEQGDTTREKGYLSYFEICDALKPKEKKRSISSESEEYSDEEEEDEEWTVMHPNPTAMGPVAFKGNQWVGYDDIDIVRKKAEYVAENGLGGIMFWSIDNDDFRGNCHGKPYPLIEAAKEAYILKLGSTDNIVVSEKPKSRGKSGGRRRNRPRTSSTTTTTTTEKPSTRSNKRKSGSTVSTTPSWNIITPEPPTTPDPGSDFKCTDEGFFPHPRDCKKYFWCLDSGPSNLGIVAHQFTCPSGLYFNKAADSCDFARNVLCKKPTDTTKAPITKAPTTKTTVTTTTTTTTRKPIRVSTKSSVLFRTTSTTPIPEEIEEYEDDDDEEYATDDAEDPKVIKELIDLIRKVGGVEQLEKHLSLSETSISTSGVITSTPTSINKRLYQKVLERARGKSKSNINSVTDSPSQNSRRGPQNEGLQPSPDQDRPLRKERPQYVTINRSRSSSTTTSTEEPLESEEIDEELESEEQQLTRGRAVGENKVATTAKPLQYVNIRRSRPTATTVSDTVDDSASRNALFERVEPYVSVSEAVNSLDIVTARRENIPEYVTIRRSRPTTETTTAQYQISETKVESQESALESEITSSSLQPQYTSILRTRSTTLSPVEEPSSPEPTTILSVQISSLLNSPTPAKIQSPESSSSISTTTEAIEVSTTTSSSPTLPTTTMTQPTSTTDAPSSTTSRRNGLRRRGSTTSSSTTTPSSISSTQVSFRNYNFVRRRRPLSTPNELSSDSEETGFSKNIKSNTPNSREVNGEKLGRETGLNTRLRFNRFSVDDSITAAASPIVRGRFRPQFNKDEELSLTPVDLDSPIFVRKQTINDNLGEETASTLNEEEEDSEISATTIEDKRPSILSRGRERYSTSAVTETIGYTMTESTFTQRRPTFARFNPRPFARPTSRPFTNNQDISPRIPQRIPFSRSRLSSTVSSNTQGLQARRLPFPSRSSTTTTTTQQALEIDDEDLENKRDDIYFSESTIEEKEHEDDKEDEYTEENPTKNKEIEKITTSVFSDTEIHSETITSDNGPRKFKVIRRKPITTTISTETTPASTVTTPALTDITPIVPRIRKIIRKKLKSNENKIEVTTTKSKNPDNRNEITSLTNYGEKTKFTTVTTTTSSGLEAEEIETEAKFQSNKQQPKLNEYNKKLEFPLQAETGEEDKSDELNMKYNSEHDQFSTNNQQFNESLSVKNNSEEEATKFYSKADQDQIIQIETDSGNINEMRFIGKMSSSEDNISHTYITENNDTLNNSKTLEEEKRSEDLPEFDVKQNATQRDSTLDEVRDINSEIQTEVNAEEEALNKTLQDVSTESKEKSVMVEVSNDKAIDLSENPVSIEVNLTQINNTSEITSETTTTSTTLSTSSSIRTRLPYRPPKRLFTSTTEPSLPSSSRSFSRKYNPGAYTSPPTIEREPFRPTVTRRPLFSRTFTRRPYTARTTKKIEEDEYSDEELSDEEIIEEEYENPFVFVPPSQLFTRKPESEEEYDDEENEEIEEVPDEEIYDEEQPQTTTTTVSRFTTTRRPLFKPRLVNSNTFRTSTTTTELPRRQFGNSQNKTIVYNRFGSIKPVNDTKKRIQNVPIGYNTPKTRQNTSFKNITIKMIPTKIEEEKITTTSLYASNDDVTTTDHDEYLSITENTTSYRENNNSSNENATTNIVEIETVTIPEEITNYPDEYLENTEKSVLYASTQDVFSTVQTEAITLSSPEVQVTTLASVKHTDAITESLPETTTNTPTMSPIIKTQYNKLFSISRVVEVSSKQDKHHLNKNNETTLIEEGPIVIEKKPSVDEIGEVSRFSLIKIVEDEIPIYLTKLGRVYPVDNPPNNPIRIDEGRNARSLLNYNYYPKENLVASESMNEAYRHINKVTSPRKESMLKREVEHIPDDDFLSYINEDKKTEKAEQYPQWQFVPAAYEDDQNKKAKKFEKVTPHVILSNPSMLPLEALFNTETAVTIKKGNGDNENHSFYVYSSTVPTKKEDINTEKTEILKPENPGKVRSVELKPIFDQIMTTNAMNKSVILETTERSSSTIETSEKITTSHIIELLNKKPAVLTTHNTTTTITSESPITTESEPTESSTVKIFPLDTKRLKFPFVRKPIIKPSNLTRLLTLPRTVKKINPSIKSNSIQKRNMTSAFAPSKSRFSSNRVQNIPVEIRNKANSGKFISKTFTTETPKSTTEKKTFTQPKNPTFRPAFVPRRSTTAPTTSSGDFL